MAEYPFFLTRSTQRSIDSLKDKYGETPSVLLSWDAKKKRYVLKSCYQQSEERGRSRNLTFKTRFNELVERFKIDPEMAKNFSAGSAWCEKQAALWSGFTPDEGRKMFKVLETDWRKNLLDEFTKFASTQQATFFDANNKRSHSPQGEQRNSAKAQTSSGSTPLDRETSHQWNLPRHHADDDNDDMHEQDRLHIPRGFVYKNSSHAAPHYYEHKDRGHIAFDRSRPRYVRMDGDTAPHGADHHQRSRSRYAERTPSRDDHYRSDSSLGFNHHATRPPSPPLHRYSYVYNDTQSPTHPSQHRSDSHRHVSAIDDSTKWHYDKPRQRSPIIVSASPPPERNNAPLLTRSHCSHQTAYSESPSDRRERSSKPPQRTLRGDVDIIGTTSKSSTPKTRKTANESASKGGKFRYIPPFGDVNIVVVERKGNTVKQYFERKPDPGRVRSH